jgi:hypothetical protein
MSLREYALAFGSGNSAAILLKTTSEDIDDLTLASAVFCPSPFGQLPTCRLASVEIEDWPVWKLTIGQF